MTDSDASTNTDTATATHTVASDATLETLARLLEAQGLSAADALVRMQGISSRRTVAEFVPVVLDSMGTATRRGYGPPLRFMVEGWSVPADDLAEALRLARAEGLTVPDAGELVRCEQRPSDARRKTPRVEDYLLFGGWADKAVEDIGEADVLMLTKWVRVRARLSTAARARKRREDGRHAFDHDGRGAEETCIAALRCFFSRAGGQPDIALSKADNRAADIKKPRRGAGTRRIDVDVEVIESWDVTRPRGDDPELDAMLYQFHIKTGARREGGLNLRQCDLDEATGRVRLDEKFGQIDWQPTAPSLIRDLRAMAIARGAIGDEDKVFRKQGKPISARRYDYWHDRVQAELQWADQIGFDAHTLRHHAGSVIERIAGKAVAHRFLRHTGQDVTDIYTHATEAEVAKAVALLTGEPHPLDVSA